ncbi:tumor necrosis factor receptor superfamily member 1B-like isoform X2 [Arapaima gigas]
MPGTVLYLLLGTAVQLAATEASSLPSAPSPAGVCEDKTKYLSLEVNLCCTMCKPGMRLKAKCSNVSDTVCELCRQGSYNDQMNYYPKCFRCPQCKSDRGLQYRQKCNSSSPSICMCKEGTFCAFRDHNNQCKECMSFTACAPGQGVSQRGTEDMDVKCAPCPEGTFSDKYSYAEPCRNHTDCRSQGRNVLQPGDTVSDTQCEPVVRSSSISASSTTSTSHAVTNGRTVSSTVSSTLSSTVSSTPSTPGFIIPRLHAEKPQDNRWIIGKRVEVRVTKLLSLNRSSYRMPPPPLQISACQKKGSDLQDGCSSSIGCRFLGRSHPGTSAAGPALSPCQEDSLWGLLLPRQKNTKEGCITASEKDEKGAH